MSQGQDIEKLRELAEAATPGPWFVYEGSSWRRIGITPGRGSYDMAVLAPCVASDGHPDLTSTSGLREENLAFIAAANPATILALLDDRAALLARVESLSADRAAVIEECARVATKHGNEFIPASHAAYAYGIAKAIRALTHPTQADGEKR